MILTVIYVYILTDCTDSNDHIPGLFENSASWKNKFWIMLTKLPHLIYFNISAKFRNILKSFKNKIQLDE